MNMFKQFSALALAVTVAFLGMPSAEAYDVPRHQSKTKYFYVFGPQGNTLEGKEDSKQEVYIDVDANTTEPVVIKVYDPDTGGQIDNWIVGEADTKTRFSVIGESTLDEKVFGSESDAKYYQFGPYNVSQGKKVGDRVRFVLSAEAISGDDQNLWNVRISPDHAESFAYDITFRLLPRSGDKMYFYPYVDENTGSITIENYDLDAEGGESSFRDPFTDDRGNINDSKSGQWAATDVALATGPERRLEYRVVTTFQKRGNAGLRIKDSKGKLIPLYFQKGKPVAPAPAPKKPAPSNACNQFVFDARDSYDPNNDKITYAWNMGDGATSTEPVVTHVYDKAGTYKVSLTVSDNSGLECQTSVTTSSVNVNLPPDAAFTGPDMTCTGSAVTFNAAATRDDTPANLSYYWAFSDGSKAEGEKVTKTFDRGGDYEVVLTVDDNAGSKCSIDSVRSVVHVNAAPTANAGEDMTLYLKNPSAPYNVTFNGTRSSDPDGDKLSYLWDLGDGTNAQGAKVSHTYAQPGDYTARLTVNDQSGTPCSVDADPVNITLNKPPIADAGDPVSTCSGNEITFDGSGSTTESGEKLSYSWNFGDGSTGTGKVANHRYAEGGRYTVTLTVDDGRGTPVSQAVHSIPVVINSMPRVSIDNVGKVCANDGITFDASSSSDPDGDKLSYTWDFGDGTTAKGGSRASHKYAKGGTYRVRVTGDDGSGASCSMASSQTTVVVNAPPVADAGPNLVCCEDQTVAFDGSGSSDPDGDSLSYHWTFGDGGTSDKARVSHAFTESGSYNLVLTVDDGSDTSCSASSDSFAANVNAKPVPVIKITER